MLSFKNIALDISHPFFNGEQYPGNPLTAMLCFFKGHRPVYFDFERTMGDETFYWDCDRCHARFFSWDNHYPTHVEAIKKFDNF